MNEFLLILAIVWLAVGLGLIWFTFLMRSVINKAGEDLGDDVWRDLQKMSEICDDLSAVTGRLLFHIQCIQSAAREDDLNRILGICDQVLTSPEKAAGPSGTEGQVRILERLGGSED